MTQIAVADEIAADLATKAAANKCSTDDLLRSMLYQWESDSAMVERLSTPEIGARISTDLKRNRDEFMTSEQVDASFEALFQELKSR